MYNYQPPYLQPPMQPTNNGGITWVCGLEGAKQYPLRPNGAVVLLDNENDRMYIKTCDNIGMCNVRTFDLHEIKDEVAHKTTLSQPVIDESRFVTRDEHQMLLNQVQQLINRMGGQHSEPISTTQPNKQSNKQYNSNGQRESSRDNQ